MIHRILQTLTALALAAGLWQHDWTVIVASLALSGTWWLIGEQVAEESEWDE